MRKLLLIVFVLFLVGACTPKHPGPPPPPPSIICDADKVCEPERGETAANCIDCEAPPPPHDVCGDKVCGESETPASCPADCKVVPPPAGKCGDEPLDPDCPPIVRNFDQHILLGNYTGPTGQPDFDWEAFFKLFPNQKGKPNGNSIHALSPWDNPTSFFPWEVKNGKFDLTKWNEKWWTHLRNGLKAAAYYDIEMEFCLIDQYGEAKWKQYSTISKIHPFRDNIQGSNVVDRLYSNWNRQDYTNPKNYALFQWKGDDEYNLDYYRPTSASGAALLKYITRFAEECATVWKEGRLRLLIRTANEPRAVVFPPDGKKFDVSKSHEIDGRTEMFVVKTFAKAGIKSGERFRMVHEIMTTFSDLTPAMYWPEKTMRAYIIPRKALAEWHSIDDVNNLNFFIGKDRTSIPRPIELSTEEEIWPSPRMWQEQTGEATKTLAKKLATEAGEAGERKTVGGAPIPAAYFIGSSDGSKETTDYPKRMNGIYKSRSPYFDFKMFAQKSGYKWDWRDLNKNVKVVVPYMLENIFK